MLLFPYFDMAKVKDNFMDLNHETAMKLWNKTFGKEIKAKDFSGREIAKGAYNDRNSEFGWNVDHILPQKLGGKTAEHNLIICNIKTNDEKADKFPGFVANGKKFTIVKVENHYEIKPVKKSSKKEEKLKEVQEETNFFDSAAGIRLYKDFKGLQTKKRFVGTVEIILKGINGADTALSDFIESIFVDEDVQFVSGGQSFYSTGTDVRILVKNYEMPFKEDISNLLDKCILLNTYLGSYFTPLRIIDDYSIYFRVDSYENRKDFYRFDGNLNFNVNRLLIGPCAHLKINNIVILNSYANEKFKDSFSSNPDIFYDYEYVFTKLAENLRKEAKVK